MSKFLYFILIGISMIVFSSVNANGVVTGAEQSEKYLPLIEGKKVGLIVNHTSIVGQTHLVDFLKSEGVNIVRIFAPEHGFRGNASPGEEILDGIDQKTGISVISLYGKNRKPTCAQLSDIDVMIFDIQDVGCRFYTYISTLHLVIEACSENRRPLIILDRPNPNGDYVAGPVLKPGFESFVGMDPIPVVHGCTVGELACMINGEKWTASNDDCELTVIQVKNYNHLTKYELPVNPSPNLPNYLTVRLYPSLCFFEATSVSVGRGTNFPFQVLGGTKKDLGDFQFTPVDIPGVAVDPVNEGMVCYGIDLRGLNEIPQFTLRYFLWFYKKFETESEFITRTEWLNLLAGTDELLRFIREGKSETEILEAFNQSLDEYKQLRKKYLLYPDFE